MKIERICKNVGWDGESYFCMRCGKAGYSTKEQAMGHLAKCKVRDIIAKLPSQPASHLASQPPSQPATYNLAELPTKLPSDTSVIERLLAMQGQQIAEIKQEQGKLSNEATHLMALNQVNEGSGFLGITAKGWLIIVGVAIVAFVFGRETKHCDCSVGDYPYKRSRNIGSGFGTAMASRIAGKFIDRIF